MKLLENRRSGGLDTVFQHTLDDPTTIGMFGELTHLPGKSVDDELDVFGRYPLNGFLHDVIAILVFDASHDLFIFL